MTNKMELIFVIPTTVSSISVQTFEGNVTLTGAVENEKQKEHATAIVNSVYGVRKESNMLWTICVILLILWLLGFLGGYMIGGFIHLLLVIAIVVVLIRVIQGRRPL